MGGRAGHAKSEDGVLDVDLTTPKEMGGDGARGTNPEQLFAAGYSACFLGPLKAAARKEKADIPADATVSAKVGIGPRDDGTGLGIDVDLEVHVPGMAKAPAQDLVDKAPVLCASADATHRTIAARQKVVGLP